MDFLNLRAREYFNKLYSEENPDKDFLWNRENVFIWNDMNEPACFNENELTFPKTTLHQISTKDYPEERKLEHREVHNIYGYYNSVSTSQALLDRS